MWWAGLLTRQSMKDAVTGCILFALATEMEETEVSGKLVACLHFISIMLVLVRELFEVYICTATIELEIDEFGCFISFDCQKIIWELVKGKLTISDGEIRR
ncbi:hypothetical protein K7X08_016015 [Anisodus acutangulus]|uniref:Uncharacterized protein n=1 Tax=Anisodus acutangulus TaxID=402998 RepID=A0A9Q1LEA6_9SOLA|nr:hypothetical protein K7X08_016015 [Anisodus acutangulus]